MADGDGRAALTLAEEVWRAAERRRDLRRRDAAGHRPAPRADLRQGAGGPLQPHLGPAQDDPRLRSRRGALLSRPHARRRRGPALHRPPAGARGESRISAWPTRRRSSIANAAKDAFDFLGSPEGELALAQAAIYLATAPKSNAVYTAYKAATPGRQGARLADAAEDDPERPDQADEGDRLRRGLRLRPRRAGRLLGPGLLAGGARPAALLRAERARLRARGPEAARMVGRSCAASAARGAILKRAARHRRRPSGAARRRRRAAAPSARARDQAPCRHGRCGPRPRPRA